SGMLAVEKSLDSMVTSKSEAPPAPAAGMRARAWRAASAPGPPCWIRASIWARTFCICAACASAPGPADLVLTVWSSVTPPEPAILRAASVIAFCMPPAPEPTKRGPRKTGAVPLVEGLQFLSAGHVRTPPEVHFHLHLHAGLLRLRALHLHGHDRFAGAETVDRLLLAG